MTTIPIEFTKVGTLAEAVAPALLFPPDYAGQPLLIVGEGDKKTAVFVGKERSWEAFLCTDAHADSWKGLLIENVTFEVDLGSVYEFDHDETAVGTLIRTGALATVVVRTEVHGVHHVAQIPVIDGLPHSSDGPMAGFRKWSVVVGRGEERIELAKFEPKPHNGRSPGRP